MMDSPHPHNGPLLLAVSALPALFCSLWMLDVGMAPRALLVQQTIVATLGLLTALLRVRFCRQKTHWPSNRILMFAMTSALFLPALTDTSSTPSRWLSLLGFRLYLAPVVLPFCLVLWHRTLTIDMASARVSALSAVLAGAALFMQPDAAQLTAFAVGAAPLVWRSPFSRHVRLTGISGAIAAAGISWTLPDPLSPVPYVEGVFALAACVSPGALAVSAAAAALPIAALGWFAYSLGSSRFLAVALYFGVLLLLAPAHVTPVPLLGYGAGPILGYFLMARHIWRKSSGPA